MVLKPTSPESPNLDPGPALWALWAGTQTKLQLNIVLRTYPFLYILKKGRAIRRFPNKMTGCLLFFRILLFIFFFLARLLKTNLEAPKESLIRTSIF